jgi:hypothetical protein
MEESMPSEVVDMPSPTSHEETRGDGIDLSTLGAGSLSAPEKLTMDGAGDYLARLSHE